MSTYKEKLLDPRWQKKRLEILQRDNFTCQHCWDKESTLHVHHKEYFKGLDPWDIKNDYLVTLCESCHLYETENMSISILQLSGWIKKLFSSGDVETLSVGFYNLELNHLPEVVASMIKYLLSTHEEMDALRDRYFKSLETQGDD